VLFKQQERNVQRFTLITVIMVAMSESVLWLLSYLRHMYYDLYEVKYSLAGVKRGLVLCFICALESIVIYSSGP
jgi:hypothetical protein